MKRKKDLVVLSVLGALVLGLGVLGVLVLGTLFTSEISEGIKFLVSVSLWLGQILSAFFGALKGGIRMWFDISVIIGAIVFNIYLFLKGLKVDEKREVLKWTLLFTTWYSLAGNAIICWLLPLIYLSDGILWQEIFKWSLRFGAMGLAAYYYLLPLFKGAVEPNQIAVRVFLWAKNRKDRVRNLESPGWYYYPSILFGFRKVSKEIEKVEVFILEVLSKRARKKMEEFEDRIMLDKAILSVRYRITDLKKLIPHMGRKKAEDYIKDEATSLLRANVALKSLGGTLEEWKAIEKAIKQGMLPLKNLGVTISTVLIHNLKVPRTKNKKEETQETKEKQTTNSSDNSEDETADKAEVKKKGIVGKVVATIAIVFMTVIIIAGVVSVIKNMGQGPKGTQQRVTGYKLQVPFPVQRSSTNVRTVEKPKVQITAEGVRTLRIPANQSWTDTGIDLNGGEKVLIVAEGTWDGSGSQAPETDLPCGAEGVRAPDWIDDMYNYPLSKNRTIHNLIGRVGGKVFHAGESFEGRIDSQGKLYLGINDYIVNDNDGYLDVTIKVW